MNAEIHRTHIKALVIIVAAVLVSFVYIHVAGADDATTQVIVGNATPSVSSVVINSSSTVTLTENTTTAVTVTATATDSNGCDSISSVNVDLYEQSVGAAGCDTGGEADNNDCYPVTSCSVVGAGNTCDGGSDTSADYECSVSLQYYANAGTWEATVTADDGTATGTDTDTETVNSLTALDVTSSIDHGTLSANSDTGTTNQTTTVTNTGNVDMDPNISGTDMTGGAETLTVDNQKYGLSNVTYGSLTWTLSTSATQRDLTLPQGTSGTVPVTDIVYWGLNIPAGQANETYSGTNTFTAASGI